MHYFAWLVNYISYFLLSTSFFANFAKSCTLWVRVFGKNALTDPQLSLSFDGLPPPQPLKPVAPRRSRTKKAALTATVMAPEMMVAALEQHPDYRILRRLVPTLQFSSSAQGSVVRVLILDTETTGLNAARDKIIELAMLRVDVDSVTAQPLGEVQVYDGLEDPGIPISAEVQGLTGISNEMVKGQRLDESRIKAMLEGVDLVVAHNAGFDRPFCESRLPVFAELDWACSFADIDWKKEGRSSAKLELLAQAEGWFYDAHRAEMDCHALLAVLNRHLPSQGCTALAKLMEVRSRASFTLQATQAPFEAKDALKARGYRWNAEQRVWAVRLGDETGLDAECLWLKNAVYGGRSARLRVEKLQARDKYSGREGVLMQRAV